MTDKEIQEAEHLENLIEDAKAIDEGRTRGHAWTYDKEFKYQAFFVNDEVAIFKMPLKPGEFQELEVRHQVFKRRLT